MTGLLHLFNLFPSPVVMPALFEKNLGVANDHAEQIVKIMGHPTGKLTNRFHLLCLVKLLGQLLVFGDVLLDRYEISNFAVLVMYRGDRLIFRRVAPILATVDNLPSPYFPGENGLPQFVKKGPRVLPGTEDVRVLSD